MADLLKSAQLFRNDPKGPKQVTSAELQGKVVGLFFAAKWNPTCVDFMDWLKHFYGLANKDKPIFEIVFISRDHSENDMKEYLKIHGPWLYTTYACKTVKSLFERYTLRQIPQMMIIQKGGTPVVDDGIDAINDPKVVPVDLINKWKKLTTE
ncbi:unnamed protein product [Bursaphelenchus okinawaensis]|uniref:protein-disulfide reductase n=1 Tax=Bursaphelenchus okinawaensis TaxID=465554 RepID=A0A811KXP8_9BILA|nr:unnamed protein product [Bursaphelenchus okinawaensis]CAG9113533.1 unnamed protein product [Bursaphelenchus okinawaensis]